MSSAEVPSAEIPPKPARLTARGIAWRLFFSCWLIYTLHFATNTVREIFLALAIGDHLSFRVDEYAGMHDDLFDKPGYGWHIGNNPGASMLGAIPYALARPVIDRVVERVNRTRAAAGARPPEYRSPWPRARAFFAEAWRRGLDVKFGLGAFVMQAFAMAPLSAASAVLIFVAMRRLLGSDGAALASALLYAFGTPVFFRTGYLNQNLLAGHFGIAGFTLLWLWTRRQAALLAGLAGGMAVLLDYSGGIILAALLVYCLARRRAGALLFAAGAVPPVLLLWFYQWQSFGHPFYPGQHWMPPVEWIERGYQGVGGPQAELASALAFDYRYGLFVSCPLLLLAFAAPFLRRNPLPRRELAVLLGTFVVFLVFFSGVNYTRLQYNTGVRYMAPMTAFLFLPASVVLWRLGERAIYFAALFSVFESWSMAMYRDVERGLGVLDPVLHVMIGGFQLPALTILSRAGGGYEWLEGGVSPLPLFALSAAILYGVWRRPRR